MSVRACLILMILTCVGCAKKIEADGFTVRERYYNEAVTDVSARASFDLDCPKDQITVRVIGAGEGEFAPLLPTSIGAQGCGKRGIYVRTPMGSFVLNGASTPVE